nr:probable palmitoyltransferase ZDHHC24 [Pogona vitticeps]
MTRILLQSSEFLIKFVFAAQQKHKEKRLERAEYKAAEAGGRGAKQEPSSPSFPSIASSYSLLLFSSYCYTCQTHVPPRCGHCFACNVCVLRRDHHCTLLGQCVGYQNYRYFMCLLLHSSLALLFGCVLNVGVVASVLQGGHPAQTILLLVLPWLMLLMGQVDIVAFCYAFVTDACVVGFLFSTGFLLFHSLLAVRGQTTKEWFEGDRQYDMGWRDNLREVLGERWYLVWFLPFLASPLPGDGITFKTKGPGAESPPRSLRL